MLLGLLGGVWEHFGRQDGSKIDKTSIEQLIKLLIDVLISKGANLKAQSLPKWSQDRQYLVNTVILSKSEHLSKT